MLKRTEMVASGWQLHWSMQGMSSQQVAHGGKGWHTPVLLLEILRMCKRGPPDATRLLKDGCRDLKGHLALRQRQGGRFRRARPACPYRVCIACLHGFAELFTHRSEEVGDLTNDAM